jgi:pimeloyl-ACP methyl ester carboxylesterase
MDYSDFFSDMSLQSQTLTNAIVENSMAACLVDQIFAGETLVISFGFVAWDQPPRFDFYGRTKKLEKLIQKPLNRILVRDFANAWYHRSIPGLGANVDQVASRLQQLIQQIAPGRVITVGQSMGGYAAILFGQLLGVDKVLAFGSLSFLNSAEALAIGDTRWLAVMEALEADPPEVGYFDLLQLCQNSSHSPAIEIIYGQQLDPDSLGRINLDDFHAQRMSALPNCTIHPYAESGHAVVQYLIDRGLIDGVLLKAMFGLGQGQSEDEIIRWRRLLY